MTVYKLFQSNPRVEKGKFFLEEFPLINAEETVILDYEHFETLNEVIPGNDH